MPIAQCLASEEQSGCGGTVASLQLWLWVLLLDIKGLGRIFAVWPPHVG